MLAVLFAAEANNETQLAISLASTRGFTPACACVASSAAETRARAVLLRASPPHTDVTLLRVDAEGDAAYHDACLCACLATLPPACAAHSYALALEAGQLLSLTPGTALPDATHGGVQEAMRAGVAAGLDAALSRRSEGYLLWTSVDYVQHASLPLLLRGDVPWSYDAAQRAWRGGAAEDVLHTSAFVLRVEDAARFLENHARFVSNVEIFAQRVAANADDGDALYFLAHSFKDAGEFSRALPVFERRVALGLRSNATQAERDHVFLAHMMSGRINSARGRLDYAVECYLCAVEALPSRRTEAFTELATMLRLAGQQSRALPFAKAASQASQEDFPPMPGTLYVNEASYDFYADLELSLSAYSAEDTNTLVAGVHALTRLLAKAHISRRYWLASYDNAAAFIAKLEARGAHFNNASRGSLAALHAARTPLPHVCSHELVSLSGAVIDAADGTACGSNSILGSFFSAVAVIELPSRAHHVARFITSLGCSHYLRFTAVTHLTPAELSRDQNPRLRNGEIRLVQAHACALQYAASLPAGTLPLAIFEDDVAPVEPASLPAVHHATARLATAVNDVGADMVLLGRCPCSAVNATLPADVLVQPSQHGFAAVCAHAYAVTPAAAAKLHAMLSASASSLPAELDIFYLRLQEWGELRVYTNAGASVYSQRQFSAALSVAELRGPRCEAADLPQREGAPALKLTSFGSWISNTVTLNEMWLIAFVLQNVTGRAVQQIDTARIAEADVIFVAVFAENRTLLEAVVAKYSAKAVIIFAVGENTHEPRDLAYRDQLVPLADVSLGHRRDVHAPTYMRFPWWIPTALARRSTTSSLDAVGFHPALLQPANASAWSARPGFALFVNSHEAHPRREMFALASSIRPVDSPGRALNTMAWPRELSNDIAGKGELLLRYRFTLCPENSMTHDRGYVTEKLPQAHLAGAVPLYWGDGVADSEVWNMRRVLSFDNRTSNAALLDTMLRLERDVDFRRAWFEEPVLASGADAWLAAFMTQLAGHFSRALAAKGHHVHLPLPLTSVAVKLSLPRVHLVSFCGCAFEARRVAFASEARASGFFDTVDVSTVDVLDAAFREKHAMLLTHYFGCGYFIWKAKAVLAALALQHMRQGDVLAYVDCGCTFNVSARAIFEDWVTTTVNAPSGLLGLQQMHLPERDWTKADLLHYLGAADVPAVTDSGQLLGGIWLMRVQPSTAALVQRWLDVKTAEAYHFLDDSPSRLPNAPSFREHRHDQSIWSVLRKQAGSAVVADITYNNTGAPIRASRCRSAEGCDPPSVNMLSGRLIGGLGDQLFVMARVHSLAALTGRAAVVNSADAGSTEHTPDGAYVGTVFSRYALTDIAPDFIVAEEATEAFVATSPPALPASARHVNLVGYWQHESNIQSDFIGTLVLPSVPLRLHTAFVHVHRSDQVGHPVHDIGLSAGDYYAAAMALLRAKAGDPLLRFLIFSDDVAWCRQSPLFSGADFDFFDGGDDTELSLMTMAACALGGVAATSFSWWAAFLNSNPLKVIVFPSIWRLGPGRQIDVWLNNSYVMHSNERPYRIWRPSPAPQSQSAFDLVLYINLDNRKDKRAAVEAELAKVGWSGQRFGGIKKTPGELGCALSHTAAVQLFLDHPSARHVLILEDDFEFVRDPRADVARFLDRFGADGWDVLMLSSNTMLEEQYDDVSYITRILDAQTTSGYAVTRAFAPTLLASFSRSSELLANVSLRHADGAVQSDHCIDQHWKRLQPHARWFCLAPRAGIQRPGLSDISGLLVDHGV